MIYFRQYSFFVLVGLLAISINTWAQDGIEDSIQRGIDVPLQWDNIEQHPEWIAGKPPERRGLRGRHEVHLNPGESTCVRIPPSEWLRIVTANRSIVSADLEVYLSNGSGLLTSIDGASDPQRKSVLFNPRSYVPMIAYITRPAHFAEGVRLGLYTSRHEPMQPITEYRGLIALDDKRKVRVGTSTDRNSLEFWNWNRGDGVRLKLRGPSRYKLQSRFRYPNHETTLTQNYHISVNDLESNPSSIATVEYITSPNTSRLVLVEGAAHVVGGLESGYFELPENRDYHISIKTNAPILLRLLRLETSDFLAPSLNRAATKTLTSHFQGSPWDLSESFIKHTLLHPQEAAADQVTLTALRLAWDNSRLEGGMMASTLFQNAGWHRRDFPEMRNRTRAFSTFSYYRNAIPERKGNKELADAFFPLRSLYPIGKQRDSLVLGESQIRPALNNLPMATFSHFEKDIPLLVYTLPERKTATRVRIVAQRDRNNLAEFEMRIPGQTTRKFRLLPETDLPLNQLNPGVAEAALTFLAGGTLDAPASFRGNTAETVPAGIFEFNIGPEVRTIKLRGGSDSDGLPVALQFRTSTPYSLSENDYADIALQAGSKRNLRQWHFDYMSQHQCFSPTHSKAKTELYNYWEPLRQFVQSHYRVFRDSVSSNVLPDSAAEELSYLEAQGEHFLAERLARSLFIHSPDSRVKSLAFAYLEKIAAQKADTDLMMTNACARLIIQPDETAIFSLANLLRQSGKFKMALMLALVLEDGTESRDLRLGLTFKQKWWAHFETILAEDASDPNCKIWKGIQLWQSGSQEAAIREWRSAGPAGQSWIANAESTAAARNKLYNGDLSGFRDWAESEIHAPGPLIWQPLNTTHYASYDSAVSVKVRERGSHFQAFVATTANPVELTIPFPGLFQVECRPIHPQGSSKPIEGWINIDGLNRGIPVILNHPSPGLQIVGKENHTPGNTITETIALSGWNNRIQIRPDFGPALIRVSRQIPEVRASNLPDLKIPTAAWIFNRDRVPAKSPNLQDYGKLALIHRDHTVSWHPLKEPFSTTTESQIRQVRHAFGMCDPVSIKNDERLEVIGQMRQLLSDFHSGSPVERTKAIAAASSLQNSHLDIPALGRMHSVISRKTFWEPLLATDQNAGFREVETPGWEPETPSILSRMRYFPELGDREHLIVGTNSSVAVVNSKEPDEISVRLSLDSIPFLVTKPVLAMVHVDQEPARQILLNSDKTSEMLYFKVPQGKSSIRVEVTETAPNQYLRVEFDSKKYRQSFIRSTLRSWFVSYREEPLSIRIDGPAWLRIDRRTESGVDSQYHYVATNLETISLPPSPNGNLEELYRVHVLRHDHNKPYNPPSHTKRNITDARPAIARQPWRGVAKKINYTDASPLGGQEDGTWTGELSYNNRRINDEDDQRGPEAFGEGRVTYRYFNEDRRTYSRTTLLGRKREDGDPTLGVKHRVQINPINSALSYSLDSSLYQQGGDWAFSGTGKISATGELSPKLKHTTSAAITGRALSRDSIGPNPSQIDRDVFTEFKNDHKISLSVAETLTYTPRQDTRLYAGVGLRTNENFISADSLNYTIGVDQLLGPVRLGADITGYRFFDDNDRDNAASRHRLNLEATSEFWTRSQQRLEAGVRYSHHLEEDENSISIFGRWHFGKGRRLRDFSPGEKVFSKLRERRARHEQNNRIHPDHQEDEIKQIE